MDSFGNTALTVPRLRGKRLEEFLSPVENTRTDTHHIKHMSRFLQNENDLNDLSTPLNSRKQLFTNSISNEGMGSTFINDSAPKSTFLIPCHTLSRPLGLSCETPDISFNRNNDFDQLQKIPNDPTDLSFCESLRRGGKWQGLNKSGADEGPVSQKSDNCNLLFCGDSFSPRHCCDTLDFQDPRESDKVISSWENTCNRKDSGCDAPELKETTEVEAQTDAVADNKGEFASRYSYDNDQQCYPVLPMASYSGKLLNPLSDDYLDQLDAHLMNAIGPAVCTQDQWTQTILNDRKTDSQDKKKVKPQRRSSSLDAEKSKKITLSQKLRSLSVPRRQVKIGSRRSSPEAEITPRKQSVEPKYKDHALLTHERNRGGMKMKTKKHPSKQRKPANRNTTSKDISNKTDVSELDKASYLNEKQQKILKDLLQSMTKEEGSILMKTVSSILKSRHFKKNVVFDDKLEVFPASAYEISEPVVIDERCKESRDDKLCESFIQTYCHYGGQPASASRSSSETVQSLNSENSSMCSENMISPFSSPEVKGCDLDCHVCHLIDEEEFEITKETYQNKRRLRMKSASPKRAKRRGKSTTISKSFKDKHEKKSVITSDVNRKDRLHLPRVSPRRCKENDSVENTWRRGKRGHRQALVDKWQGGEVNYIGNVSNRRNRSNSVDSTKKENSIFNGSNRCIRIRSVPEKKPSKSLLKITEERDTKKMNEECDYTEKHTVEDCIKTPTPSPTSINLCLPATHSAIAKPSEVHSKRENSVSSWSNETGKKENPLKELCKKSDNFENVSFDVTSCQSETSLSQKIAELNLSRDGGCDVTMDQISTTCPSETSISQKIAELNLSRDRERDGAEQTSMLDKPQTSHKKSKTVTFDAMKHNLTNSPQIVENETMEMMLQINKTTQNLLQKADDKMKKMERFLDTMSNIQDLPLPEEKVFKAQPNVKHLGDPTCTDYVPPLSFYTKTPYTPDNSRSILHKMPPPPIKAAIGPYSAFISPTRGRRIHALALQNPCTFNVNGRYDFQNSSIRPNAAENSYTLHNRTALPGTLSFSKETSLDASKGVNTNSSSRSVSLPDEQRLVYSSGSSASLTTNSWDSPLLSLDSSGSFMEVTKLDETFTYDDNGNRHCTAEVRMTKSIFSNNQLQLPRQRAALRDANDDSSSSRRSVNKDIGTVPTPVLVKSYHVPTSMIPKTRSSSYSPDAKTDRDPPSTSDRICDANLKTQLRLKPDPEEPSEVQLCTPLIGSAREIPTRTEDFVTWEIPRPIPHEIEGNTNTHCSRSSQKHDNTMRQPTATHQPLNAKNVASNMSLSKKTTISTRAKAKKHPLLKRTKTLPPFRV